MSFHDENFVLFATKLNLNGSVGIDFTSNGEVVNKKASIKRTLKKVYPNVQRYINKDFHVGKSEHKLLNPKGKLMQF